MKIRFEPVNKKHLKQLNAIVNDPQVTRFLSLSAPCPISETIRFYKIIKAGGHFWWAILCDGKIVGSINLIRKGMGIRAQKVGHVVEFGISIVKSHWGIGLGKRATQFAKKQAKQNGFRRFELEVVKENKRAIALYKKCGFKKEGIKKGFYHIDGIYYDVLFMSKRLN